MITKCLPWVPIQAQPSAPRPLNKCLEERDAWVQWHQLGGDNLLTGRFSQTKSWKRVPSAEDAMALLTDCMERGFLPASDHVKVRCFASGASNVLFAVTCEDWEFKKSVLRLAMPYDPYYKTESEVASMMFAAAHDIPVPRCIMVDSSANNPLGLEWMLLEMIEAAPSLESVFYSADLRRKTGALDPEREAGYQIIREIGSHSRSLEATSFGHIGSLYYDWECDDFYVGTMVDSEFLDGDRLRFSEGARGPFESCVEYLRSLATVKMSVALDWLSRSRFTLGQDLHRAGRQRARDSVRHIDDITAKLLGAIEKFNETRAVGVGGGPFNGTWCYLQHEDLNAGNILLGSPGDTEKVRAIVDWECCRVVPPFFRRSHGVPVVNDVFVMEDFPDIDRFTKDSLQGWAYYLRDHLARRPLVAELLPREEHVSPTSMVLHMLYREVRKMDPRAAQDTKRADDLRTFLDWFTQRNCRETSVMKIWLTSLNDPEDTEIDHREDPCSQWKLGQLASELAELDE